MFTKGVLKIFRLSDYGHLDVTVATALKSKESAFLHNGQVYVFDAKNNPVRTPFTVEDFEVNFASK